MSKKSKGWYDPTFGQYELGNFKHKEQRGIAVGGVARRQEGAKKVKNNFKRTK
jgi:hypothetical protein